MTKRGLIGVVTALCAVGAMVAAPPGAHADGGQTFTWTCDHNADWTEPTCWDLGSAPQDGDSAIITAGVPITNVPVLSLADLTLAGTEFTHLDPPYGTEGGITVTGNLIWSGGTLNMPLDLPAGSHALVGGLPLQQSLKEIDGDITLGGDLALTDTGDSDATALWFDFDHSLVVLPGASVTANGTNRIAAARCCSAAAPSRVINQGSVTVGSGRLELTNMGLDQHADLTVDDDAELSQTGGMVRLRGGSRLLGGGTVRLADTTGPQIDAEHPEDNQGGVLLDGTVTLVGGPVLALDTDAVVTGTGRFAGAGLITLHEATVYADLTTTAAVPLVIEGDYSQVGVWRDQAGYRGRLTLGGPTVVMRGGVLRADAGTVTRVAKKARLAVVGGGRITSGSCCSSAPTLIVDAGGRLILGDASGRTARVEWTTLKNDGRLEIAGPVAWQKVTARQPDGTLSLTGALHGTGSLKLGKASTTVVNTAGKAYGRLTLDGALSVAGTLKTSGSAPHGVGRNLKVLTAGSRTGRFGCARTGGWIPTYTGRGVVLSGTGGKQAGCLQATAPKKRLTGKVTRSTRSFSVPFGSAKAVALDVRIRAKRGTKVVLTTRGGGKVTLKVGRKALHRLLAFPVGHVKRFTVHTARGSAKVAITYLGRYR